MGGPLGFQGFPHPGNAFLGCFDYLRIILLEREFQGGCVSFGVNRVTCTIVKHFEANELGILEAALAVVLNGYASACVHAAGNSNSLLPKMNPFIKIGIVFPTGEYRNWFPISVAQLFLRFPEAGKGGADKSNS